MLRSVRYASMIALFSSVLPGIARADVSASDLTINLSMKYPSAVCSVSAYGNEPGSPAFGSADFRSLGPWAYSFQTAAPLSHQYDDQTGYYYASFGQGGSFSMSGPNGMTFSGKIERGHSYSGGPVLHYGTDLSFSGKWSNGMQGQGTLTESYSEDTGSQATLNVQTSSPSSAKVD